MKNFFLIALLFISTASHADMDTANYLFVGPDSLTLKTKSGIEKRLTFTVNDLQNVVARYQDLSSKNNPLGNWMKLTEKCASLPVLITLEAAILRSDLQDNNEDYPFFKLRVKFRKTCDDGKYISFNSELYGSARDANNQLSFGNPNLFLPK